MAKIMDFLKSMTEKNTGCYNYNNIIYNHRLKRPKMLGPDIFLMKKSGFVKEASFHPMNFCH